MKVKREWMENEEVFDAVTQALDRSEELGQHVRVRAEEGRYGDLGEIVITLNGRRFTLELHEEM